MTAFNRLLSPQQIAERLGVSSKTVYRKYETWGLEPHRAFLPLLRFKENDVNNFIERTNA
jgi:excisionase family DNA binding protein